VDPIKNFGGVLVPMARPHHQRPNSDTAKLTEPINATAGAWHVCTAHPVTDFQFIGHS
jgi:hypothetical protein